MKKLLPINISNIEGIYYDNIFFNCICSSSLADGDKLAKVHIYDYRESQWKQLSRNVDIQVQDEDVTICGDPNEKIMTAYMYRDLRQNDELTIQIDYQQYTFSWATISLFVAEKDKIDDGKVIGEDNGKLKTLKMEYGYYSENKLHLWCDENMLSAVEFPHGIIPLSLKLVIKDELLQLYAKTDSTSWEMFQELDMKNQNLDYKKLYVGVLFNMGERQWNDWKHTNFIQLYTPKDEFLPDYFYTIEKEGRGNLLNFFLEYSNDRVKNIKMFAHSFVEYLKSHIQFNEYCITRMVVDEKKIRTAKIRKRDNEANLLYGFDDEKELFYGLQVSANKIECIEVNYNQVEAYYNAANPKEFVKCIKYRPSAGHYNLNIPIIISFLKDYINGTDSFQRHTKLLGNQEENIYGIQIYGELFKEDNLNKLADDVIVLAMLLEHKKRMQERIDYLTLRNVLEEDVAFRMHKNLLACMELINQLYSNKLDIDEKRAIVNNIKCIEEILYKELIEKLELCVRGQ